MQVFKIKACRGWRNDPNPQEYQLGFQRTRVLLPAPTQRITGTCNSSSKGSMSSSELLGRQVYMQYTNIHAGKTRTPKHINK